MKLADTRVSKAKRKLMSANLRAKTSKLKDGELPKSVFDPASMKGQTYRHKTHKTDHVKYDKARVKEETTKDAISKEQVIRGKDPSSYVESPKRQLEILKQRRRREKEMLSLGTMAKA